MEFAQIQETCQAEGYPPPKLTWIRLVMPLPAGETEVKEGKLTIRNLRPVDSGLYQCVATNRSQEGNDELGCDSRFV